MCTATSEQTHELATSLGLRVVSPDEIGALDIAIDGADEVDPAFNLTKGGGGAHTREKVVAQMAPRFVVVVDESKLVDHLGPFGTPLEVLDFAPAVVAGRVRALGATEVTTRERRSDNGNLLMDADFGTIADPVAPGRRAGRRARHRRARDLPRHHGRARRRRQPHRREGVGQQLTWPSGRRASRARGYRP